MLVLATLGGAGADIAAGVDIMDAVGVVVFAVADSAGVEADSVVVVADFTAAAVTADG